MGSGTAQCTYTIDLPAPLGGAYDIRVALGDIGVNVGANYKAYLQCKDGSTVLFTVDDNATGTTGGADDFVDAAGTHRTIAQWISSNTKQTVTVAGSTLTFKIKHPSNSTPTAIAHMRITRVG